MRRPTMAPRRLIAIFCVIVAVSIAFPLSAAFALDKITMAITGTSSDVGSFIALDKGYFRAEGLDIDQQTTGMGVTTIAPLAAGEFDIAMGAATVPFYNAVARKVGVKIVASVSDAPPGYGHNLLIVRNALIVSGRYKQPTDIKGLKIAMPSPGSSATATLNAWLTAIGLTFNDIEPVYLTYPNHVVALANGSIDVGLTTEPQASQAIAAGSATRVTSDDEMDPNHEASVMLYSDKFIRERPEVGLRFMRAYLRGVRDYNDSLQGGKIGGPNADEVIGVLTKYTELKDGNIYRSISPQGAEPDGMLNVASLKKDLVFYKLQGWIEAPVEVEQAIDTSFATKAAKDLGPYVKKQ